MIKLQTYNLNNIIITKEVLSSYVSKFWEDVFSKIDQTKKVKHLMVLCKVKYSDESEIKQGYKTLGPLRRVLFKDKDLFIKFLNARLGLLTDSYTSNIITEINFTYIIKDGEINTLDRTLLEDLSIGEGLASGDKNLTFHNFNKINLPISMNPSNYGTIRGTSVNEKGDTRYFVIDNNTDKMYEIDISKNKLINKVTILGSSDFKWIDTKLNDNLFKRDIGKSTLYFLEGELVLQKRFIPTNPFTRFRQ